MKVPPLPTLLSTFFLRYLALERSVSPHTSTSYRDAIKLLLQFSATRCKRSVDQLVIEDLKCSSGVGLSEPSGNQSHQHGPHAQCAVGRRTTLFRYIAGQQPSLAALCSPVLAIPAKKALRQGRPKF